MVQAESVSIEENLVITGSAVSDDLIMCHFGHTHYLFE